jgi:hypothetical protein
MITHKKDAAVPVLLWIGLAVAGFFIIWSWLQGSGFISHDAVVTVYSPAWQVGEYKSCTVINGSGESRSQPILYCEDALSVSHEDGKPVNVKFSGNTHDARKKPNDLLFWKCKKNRPDSDAAFDCRKDSQSQ